MKHRGVKFYSEHDMSFGFNIQKAETFLQNWDERVAKLDINTALELYNIKRYFDANIRLEKWDDVKFTEYKEKCKLIPRILGRFFSTVSNSNIEILYKTVNRYYIDDFWSLICDFKAYQRIKPSTLGKLMESNDGIVWYILRHRVLVTSFGQVIAEHLVHNQNTAERLISHFLATHKPTCNQIYFPCEFTQEMRDKVLADYVDQGEGNINYLRLLEQAQNTKEFPVSDRLKLKARRKSHVLQEKLFAGSVRTSYGVTISFKSIPDGSVEESYNDNVVCYAYSREWIEENQDYPTLLNNFIYLFEYVDCCHRCTFTSLKSELDAFERHLGIKGKKDYAKGIVFNMKQIRSLLQMQSYQQELFRLDIRLEDIFKWFFEVYLKEEFNAVGFTYSPPSVGTTYAEKCKLLAISIDGVLKQYRLFCEDGYVDRELLEMSSGHVVFSNLVSLRKKKYAYTNVDNLLFEQHLLYSDQSMLSYTEKTGDKYKTLPQLLMTEKITLDDFEYYQQNDIQWLIDRGTVNVINDGCLSINEVRAYVLYDLFTNEVICPAYYMPNLQQQVEELVSAGEIRYANTLFSKPEQDYLNYALNKSEFSNGLDLRNKYSHDTCSLDENAQAHDYLELLKIMVLLIIKINEEFCVKNPTKYSVQ